MTPRHPMTPRHHAARHLHSRASLAGVFLVASLGLILWGAGASAAGIEARAYGAWLNLPSRNIIDQTICDTGWLPPTGGSLADFTPYTEIPGVLLFYSMSATSHDDNGCTGDDFSTVALDGVLLFPDQPGEIRLTSGRHRDDDDCCNPADDDFRAATFIDLVVEGQPIVVTGLQDQVVQTTVGTLVINEKKRKRPDDDCDDDAFTLNALHLYLTSGEEVILGSVHHDDDEDCCATSDLPTTWGRLKAIYR